MARQGKKLLIRARTKAVVVSVEKGEMVVEIDIEKTGSKERRDRLGGRRGKSQR